MKSVTVAVMPEAERLSIFMKQKDETLQSDGNLEEIKVYCSCIRGIISDITKTIGYMHSDRR